MEFLLILFGIFLAVGLFMLLANALKIPYLKTSKAVMNTGRNDKKLSKSIEAILLGIAAKIGKQIEFQRIITVLHERGTQAVFRDPKA